MIERKTVYTSLEADEIRQLLREKARASQERKKAIRGTLRDKLGFRIRAFSSNADAFTLEDFEDLIRHNRITVVDKGQAIRIPTMSSKAPAPIPTPRMSEAKTEDESYIIDLCDKALNALALRQHRFSFLLGDAGTPLPVDAYYPTLKLVIEYRERQHTEAVPLFDRRMTTSGVTRDMQRRLYDDRRAQVLPKHGVDLVVLSYSEFAHTSSKRLLRRDSEDIKVIRGRLAKWL